MSCRNSCGMLSLFWELWFPKPLLLFCAAQSLIFELQSAYRKNAFICEPSLLCIHLNAHNQRVKNNKLRQIGYFPNIRERAAQKINKIIRIASKCCGARHSFIILYCIESSYNRLGDFGIHALKGRNHIKEYFYATCPAFLLFSIVLLICIFISLCGNKQNWSKTSTMEVVFVIRVRNHFPTFQLKWVLVQSFNCPSS